jgi:hypothetical protein
MLIISITPNTSVRPDAISAYTPPVNIPVIIASKISTTSNPLSIWIEERITGYLRLVIAGILLNSRLYHALRDRIAIMNRHPYGQLGLGNSGIALA